MAPDVAAEGGGEAAKRQRTAAFDALGGSPPDVSVLVPCKNAMPWLPLAVRSPLLQLGLHAEVLVVDDWSTDGSREWLEALVLALGPSRARIERAGEAPPPGERNLATVIPRRPSAATPNFGAAAAMAAPAGAGEAPAAAPRAQPPPPLGAEAVAAEVLASGARCCLRVLSNRGHGQGAALQTALDTSAAPLVAHIEADDEYGARRLATMRDALLAASPPADAVFSATELTGSHVTAGMTSYIQWQNGLLSADALAAGRFVELPSLHQVGLYTRASLDASAKRMPGACASARALVYRELEEWPVDYDFALRWFEAGNRGIKLPSSAAGCAYEWRQHGSNGTRWQGRCSLDALRACKAHFLARALRAESGAPARVQLCSVGRTLDAWASALAAEGVEVVQRLEWNPKQKPPAELGLGAGGGGRRGGVAARAPAPAGEDDGGGRGRDFVRLFVYGSAPIRSRVSRALEGSWDPKLDFFAA